MNQGDNRLLLRDILKGVSRSFYLTIRALPPGVRQPVAVAYLLARAADTIADTRALPPQERLERLLAFRAEVEDPAPFDKLRMEAVSRIVSGVRRHDGGASPAETALLDSVCGVFSLLEQAPESDRARVRPFPRADFEFEDPCGSIADADLERVGEPVLVELWRTRPRRVQHVTDLVAVSDPDPVPEIVEDEKEVVEVIVDGRGQPEFVSAPDDRLHRAVRLLPAHIDRELVRADDVPFPEDVAEVVHVPLHVGPKPFEGTVGPGVPSRFDRALDEQKGRLGVPAIVGAGPRSRCRRCGDLLGSGSGREAERRHGDRRGGGHGPCLSRRDPPARHRPTP